MAEQQGSIRFNPTTLLWEASSNTAGGDGSFVEISLVGHHHVSADISDATSAPTPNVIADRNNDGGISFAYVNIAATAENLATAALNPSRISVGIQDPSMITQGQLGLSLRTGGTAPPLKTLLNDGAAITQVWNATRGTTITIGTSTFVPQYVVNGPAAMIELGQGLWRFSTGAVGSAGNPITWVPQLALQGGSFYVGPASSPTFSVAIGGNAAFANNVTAVAFNTASKLALKENVQTFEESALDILSKLKIVSFNYKKDKKKTPRVGIIADWTEDTRVSGLKRDSFDLSNAIGLLIKAVQELKEERK